MKRGSNFQMTALLMALSVTAAPAVAATAEERLAQDYLEAASRGDAARLLDFYHPDEIAALRARVLKALEAEATAGGDTVRTRAFGIATTMETVRRTTPVNLFVQLSARVSPAERTGKAVALGTVVENPQTSHVLARLMPPPGLQTRPSLAVVTLLRYGKAWRVALPQNFQDEIDTLLQTPQGAGQAEDPAAQSAPNFDDINAMLERGVELLSNGKCASYFNELMSPRFLASTSAQALQRLIVHCERSVDTRETYIAALQVARKASPRYEESGTRAVYDMTGKGLPFQRFVLERVDRRWFIAE
jgi:hypothetical protein